MWMGSWYCHIPPILYHGCVCVCMCFIFCCGSPWVLLRIRFSFLFRPAHLLLFRLLLVDVAISSSHCDSAPPILVKILFAPLQIFENGTTIRVVLTQPPKDGQQIVLIKATDGFRGAPKIVLDYADSVAQPKACEQVTSTPSFADSSNAPGSRNFAVLLSVDQSSCGHGASGPFAVVGGVAGVVAAACVCSCLVIICCCFLLCLFCIGCVSPLALWKANRKNKRFLDREMDNLRSMTSENPIMSMAVRDHTEHSSVNLGSSIIVTSGRA